MRNRSYQDRRSYTAPYRELLQRSSQTNAGGLITGEERKEIFRRITAISQRFSLIKSSGEVRHIVKCILIFLDDISDMMHHIYLEFSLTVTHTTTKLKGQ
jgi:type II restriction/modification system DNA methylase subunit YeeA